MQDASEVLNPDHLPTPNDDVKLFEEKQKFMRDVFDAMLQTDQEKKRAREHEGDYNAQSARENLNELCTESTNARVRSSTTLSHAASAKVEPRKSDTEAFMLHWQYKIRVRKALVPTGSHFSEH